uniref:Uncharacterized protein n=1 Tax=Candidatus Kentrum sp. LFY TaxID=2126342 RepID=A0A450UZ89_9GAMM|nr:MAG: hypothetical protein BECKLFY1418A_GA0070994_10747 [Candidatus Kentron sp. LFY]
MVKSLLQLLKACDFIFYAILPRQLTSQGECLCMVKIFGEINFTEANSSRHGADP